MDWVIRDARIIDGAGNPATYGDVGLTGGAVSAVGRIRDTGAREIDAGGLTLAPGFWDPHTHTEYGVLFDRGLQGFVAQGVTTIITGNCGTSVIPTKRLRSLEVFSDQLTGVEWWGLKQYVELVESRGTPINSSPLIGNGCLRAQVIGNEPRRATPTELGRMLELLEQGLADGALGMSTGLDYIPSVNSDTDELTEFCRMLAKYGALYSCHTRDCSQIYAFSYHPEEVLAPAQERALHLAGVLEVIELAARTGVRVHVSHLHSSGIVGTEMAAIRQARKQGIDISVDAMSYNVSYSIRSDKLLLRVKERSPDLVDLPVEQVRTMMKDPGFRDELSRRPQLRRHISPERAGTWELSHTGEKGWDGRLVGDVASELGVSPVELMFELMLDEERPVGIVPPAQKIRTVCREQIEDRLIMPCSDAMGFGSEDVADDAYATYSARGHVSTVRYWRMGREFGIPEEELVRRMTSMVARRFGLWDRGMIATGQRADIVLFCPDEYRERGDTHHPFSPAAGVRWVFVNGVPVIEDGVRTDALPGRILLSHNRGR